MALTCCWTAVKRRGVRELLPGAMLIKEGDEPTFVLLVLIGKLEVFVERHGRRLVLSEAGPGTILGELAVRGGSRYRRPSAQPRSQLSYNGLPRVFVVPSPQCFFIRANLSRIAPHTDRERAFADPVTRSLIRQR